MCQENAGAKKRNQQHRTHPNTRLRAGSTINKRSAFQNDFVALEKWWSVRFRELLWRPRHMRCIGASPLERLRF
jgi:hypothetical protein